MATATPTTTRRHRRTRVVHASDEPSDKPEEGHEHGKPTSIREYFKQEDLAQQYNLHQEANKIDIAALTDQIVLSKESAGSDDNKYRVQLSADRLHGAGPPGTLSTSTGTSVDASLTSPNRTPCSAGSTN